MQRRRDIPLAKNAGNSKNQPPVDEHKNTTVEKGFIVETDSVIIEL